MALAGTKYGGYKPAVWSRSVAQPGSAHRSGRWGRRFKSCHSDQKKQILSFFPKSATHLKPLLAGPEVATLKLCHVLAWDIDRVS
ncbi:hypothetical protein BQ8794_60257 [Mesorhizobium prunaredense]|uniref:Uncharacterized protein n=1 Tax=Mesorhizobium prunaredense TaxID=1631249 RepID=A0A1R3VI47_9HYPH|nr:hypothetical protein BQ8794_60257 [Mesorhizobium prunaredense]